jgi:hypothetical protein
MSDEKRLSLARARQKLGGRVASHGDAGAIVQVRHSGAMHPGVILWSDESWCDVWLGDEATRRVRVRDYVKAIAPASSPLHRMAQAVRAFAAFREGESVRTGEQTVKLVEKCRWGALVAGDDGRIFAVGFRRLIREPN